MLYVRLSGLVLFFTGQALGMEVPMPWHSLSAHSRTLFFPFNSHFLLIRWLGQNSKTNKLSRQLGDIQVRMRLKVSGDKSEIRQVYIPALFPHIVQPLMDTGAVRTASLLNLLCLVHR
jgi:hypothetical protein